ncbi:TIGR04066 family peptide maturation system protein [Ruminiclostridium herbifermentans]|uniref:TIGR04066 family peptide maturation system protein n=1 Tax=Ruminiclostridium herbifermentans TaxID=2488810 RepID=A0A4U7J6I9_9FIRM|nr:TIGR04066 family peptide maturation system protein [Ruminiclostridium herbifermentans]QNU66433.1 TIGR04066 family peptide maturation system protein [Ruminiclostridium herbifermentans]
MENVLVYPYNKSYQPYVWNGEIDGNKIIKSLVSPSGWGIEGKEVQSLTGKYVVSSNFSYELKGCSTVWFVEDDALPLPEDLLISKVQEAVENGKDILYTRYKDKQLYDKVMTMLQSTNKQPILREEEKSQVKLDDFCYSIKVPIIAILGLEEGVQKFDVQVALWRKLKELGYEVEAISTRLDSEVIGMNSIPQFMFETGMSETQKIIQYNHYVKQIELTKKPDIIILGVPGSVMPFDSVNHNNFGIMSYLISMAVPVDYAILCAPFYTNSDFDFTDINRDIYHKFGFEVAFCHIAPITLDLRSIFEDSKRRFFTLKEDYIQQELRKHEKDDVGYVLTPNNIEKLAHRVLEVLS